MIRTAAGCFWLVVFPPLLPGVIQKTKAWFAGRTGSPLLQGYFDLWRLLGKGAVYSRTTTWVFKAAPLVGLAAAWTAGSLLPLGGGGGPFAFDGDLLLFAGLLAAGRFMTMAAALDTGSSFEGMGASREATVSALTEPALFLALAIPATARRSLSLAGILGPSSAGALDPAYLAGAAALFLVLLAECARIPIDDPDTHLELTMIHEVMVLDHGGPDLAFLQLASSIKLFVFSALIVRLLVALPAGGAAGAFVLLGGTLAVSVIVGVVESVTARLRLSHLPELLVSASVLAGLGLAALLVRGVP